jgi:hypothetical protein
MGEDFEDQQDEAEERQRAQIAQKNDIKPEDQLFDYQIGYRFCESLRELIITP